MICITCSACTTYPLDLTPAFTDCTLMQDRAAQDGPRQEQALHQGSGSLELEQAADEDDAPRLLAVQDLTVMPVTVRP